MTPSGGNHTYSDFWPFLLRKRVQRYVIQPHPKGAVVVSVGNKRGHDPKLGNHTFSDCWSFFFQVNAYFTSSGFIRRLGRGGNKGGHDPKLGNRTLLGPVAFFFVLDSVHSFFLVFFSSLAFILSRRASRQKGDSDSTRLGDPSAAHRRPIGGPSAADYRRHCGRRDGPSVVKKKTGSPSKSNWKCRQVDSLQPQNIPPAVSAEFYRVLPSFTEFYRVLPSFSKNYLVLSSCFRILPSFT